MHQLVKKPAKSNISSRLSEIIEERGITCYQLAKFIGKSDSTISRIIKKGAKPNSETIKLICDYFEINDKWFLTGYGVKNLYAKPTINTALNNLMCHEDYIDIGKNKFIRIAEANYFMLTPLVRKLDQNKFLDKFDDSIYINSLPFNPYTVSKPLDDFYLSFEVVGDDMSSDKVPSLDEGYIATAQVINPELWNSRFLFKKNKVYYIIHEEGIFLREVIDYCRDLKCMTVHAYNPAYPDEKIYFKNCKMILEVIGVTWRL